MNRRSREAIPPPVPTLSELITQRRNQLRLSYKQIAERAQAAGHQLTESGLYSLVNDKRRSLPQPDTIQAIAVVLDVPVYDVFLAAGREVGLSFDTDPSRRAGAVVAELVAKVDPSRIDEFLEFIQGAAKLIKPTDPPSEPGTAGAVEAT